MPQNYQYAEYPFLGLIFGVVVLPDSQVVTTNMALAAALGVVPSSLREAQSQHPQSFNPLSVSGADAREIREMIRRHRAAFMVRRVRDDLLLWTEEDMYMHCHYSRSERAAQFMQHNVRFLREWRMANIPLIGISPERFAQLELDNSELRQQVQNLTTRFDNLTAHPPIDGTASVKFTLN